MKKDKNGQRSVEAHIEVPGTPEEVWQAIASGDGISSWFVPSKVDGREGGETVTSFGPGMDAVAKITAWRPPHSYIAESEDDSGAGPSKVATEWIVEAREGGTCTVRVVHRWFASTDDWDGQFEGHAYGWATSFFRMLRLYLEHFPGQPCSMFQLSAFSQSPGPETWRAIKSALPVDAESGHVRSGAGVPELVGVVEDLDVTDPELLRIRETSPHIVAAFEGMDGESPELLIRLERPAPGFAHIFTMPMGGPTMVSARFHFFGEHGAKAAVQAERDWGAWLGERFPAEA
ncbi:MAG: SRPBCC domain-containing protein [Phycisphaerales bacterium]|nr:MAG: SRPBCC domain-containing protein [Phycisphaerales bacterium]